MSSESRDKRENKNLEKQKDDFTWQINGVLMLLLLLFYLKNLKLRSTCFPFWATLLMHFSYFCSVHSGKSYLIRHCLHSFIVWGPFLIILIIHFCTSYCQYWMEIIQYWTSGKRFSGFFLKFKLIFIRVKAIIFISEIFMLRVI